MIDISCFTVSVAPFQTEFESRIQQIFCDIIKEKSGIKLPASKNGAERTIEFYHEDGFVNEELMSIFEQVPRPGREGFRIRYVRQNGRERLIVLGRDERGEFYGMARILRKAEIRDGLVLVPETLDGMSVTPEYPLRGYQLGYRDKNNTYSAWDLHDFENYIRDLELFGANAIELLPPKTDDHLYSASFREDPFELMIEVSKIIHADHMDVWLWYPNVGRDYTDPQCVKEELAEREKVFAAIPYLDAILVPLGDPGSLSPAEALRLTGQFVKIMHTYHPEAKTFVAPQHFQPEPGWYDEFYAEMAKEPDWVDGVSFAPWVQDQVWDLQKKLPEKYQRCIRNYPDISHNTNCQFPVPEWDMAFALVNGRESYNARPREMKKIHNLIEPYTIGSITYSEGIHDDVNKIIWADQDFDSGMDPKETLEDYARLLISSENARELADLILRIEQNWEGPVLENEGIDRLYEDMLRLDQRVDEKTRGNFRYQMIKLRILTDHWVKQKYREDQKLECEARKALAQADVTGSQSAIAQARSILHFSEDRPAAEDVLFEMEKLSDILFQSCGIQLTQTRHGGQQWIRGAYMETRHMPLNEYQFLIKSFQRVEKLGDETERVKALKKLNERISPGEGNLYCCPGSYEGFQHVTKWKRWEEDPGCLQTPLMDHSIYNMMGLFHDMDGWYDEFPMPLSWAMNVTVLYGTPLQVTFDQLDPDCEYILKVFYPNSFLKIVRGIREDTKVRLWAGDCLLADRIPWIEIDEDSGWYYDLPKQSYQDGTLKLRWEVYGTLEAFAVSEIWILKKKVNKEAAV